MKKFLLGLLGVVIALVAAALVVPSFLDWNQYKAEIATLVETHPMENTITMAK